jgi:hypothetical protein
MRARDAGFVLCIANRGAEDLDESGEDYLYPAAFFVSVEVPHKARRAWLWHHGPQSGGFRRTSGYSGPELALLAPAAERQRSPHEPPNSRYRVRLL